MNITIHGVGYVGLVTGACFAEAGNHVMCFDINAARIDQLQQGKSPLYEPGLEALLTRHIAAGRLSFTNDVQAAVDHAEVQFIAVSTPPHDNGDADLSYVLTVARNIATHMTTYKLIVNKSTVPVNGAEKVRHAMQEITTLPFDVASNPEFLKESMAIDDFMHPSRVVIGVDSERAETSLKALYAPFVLSPEQLLCMDVKSAELSKYASNAMLATRISFMNEMARLADALGGDIEYIRVAMGMDPRIGPLFLHPGPGYGGSCFPKDMKALIHMGKTVGVTTAVLSAVEAVNEVQKKYLFDKMHAYFNGEWTHKTIAVWGLAFKANTDDTRESASLVLIDALLAAGASVRAYDPLASCDRVCMTASAEEALSGADALVIMTDPVAFKNMDMSLFKSCMVSPVVFDARNIYDPEAMQEAGIEYHAIGRLKIITQKEHLDEAYS